MKKRLRINRWLSGLLVVIMLVVVLSASGCSGSEKKLMTLGDQSLSVNDYELLLSRMKGTLEYNGYPVDEDLFWDEFIDAQGTTYNDFFCSSIQDEAKKMLIKLYLFEEVYGLTLPQKEADEVDQYIADIVSLDFDESTASFHRALSAYGVNAETLKENYIAEEKISALLTHVSSITSENAKQEYYQANYIRFRQILFPLYEYVFETDENGDDIYYHDGSDQVYYDTVNGNTKKDENGAIIVDKNGDVMYFTSDGRVAYQSEKGIRKGVDADTDGYVDFVELDEETVAAVTDRANHIKELLTDGDFALFESYGEQWSDDDVWSSYPNGIYLNESKTYSIDYLDDIQQALKSMQAGEITLIKSDHAYHLIMKYALEEEGYNIKENSDWFETFELEVASSIVDKLCEKYLSDIVVDEKALASAMDMKTVGANMRY